MASLMLVIALLCAVLWAYPTRAGETLIAKPVKPLTTTQVEAVLATYQDFVAAAQSRGTEFRKFIFVSPRGFGLLGPYDVGLRAACTDIAQERGFIGFEVWRDQFLRALAAHSLPYFRHARARLIAEREKISKDDVLGEAGRAQLISQIDDIEPSLLATIAQAEPDLPSVAPYANQLEAIFPRPWWE